MLTPIAAAVIAALVSLPAGPPVSTTVHAHDPAPTPAETVLDRMSLPQAVGQLFLVGTPADRADRRTASQIRRLHVGNVMLTGRSHGGVRPPARVVRTMRAQVSRASTSGVGLLVATDQEGGQVRVLQGPGLSPIPSALEQGRWSPERLQRAARRWGGELRRAGVDLDLAPVLDTVPSPRAARHNPPIGAYDRQLGYSPRVVARHGVAIVRGLTRAGVATAVKHFPGLGRVRANTDTSRDVVDRVTGPHDPYLRPFRDAIRAGTSFVMMSTARYTRLDPTQPAAFSPYVVTTLLRRDLGFDGVVVSDDLAHARQVADVPPGRRAVRFLAAGGDLVLTVDPAVLPAMYDAVLAKARSSAGFRAVVHDAALRVLTAKQEHGLL